MYLGNLSKFTPEQRLLLLHRLEAFLQSRYDSSCDDISVEQAAISYYSRYYARHIKGSPKVGAGSGGGIVPDELPDVAIDLSTLQTVDVREAGASWLCWQAIAKLGLRDKLLSLGIPDKMSDVILLNLIARLVYPVSENKTYDWLAEQSAVGSWLSGSEKVYRSELYRSIVVLLSHQSQIETYLYEKISSYLGNSNKLMLYDLTNTYFEGRMLGSNLACYGRSKEKRSDCRLVSIGLLCNSDGLIRKADFYAGNVSEPATLTQIMEQLRHYGGVMTDAGIATVENIELLAANDLQYMCVSRQNYAAYRPELTDADAFTHRSSQGHSYTVWVKAVAHSFTVGEQVYQDNLVFVKSQAKQDKENAMQQLQRKRFEKELLAVKEGLYKPKTRKNVSAVLQKIGRLKEKYSSVQSAYTLQIIEKAPEAIALPSTIETNKTDKKTVKVAVKKASIKADAAQTTQVADVQWAFDATQLSPPGEYVIRTNVPINTPKEAWQQYHTISNIEASNRCCKSDLALRPVFHRKDETIKGHLLLTLLACNIVHFVRQQLAQMQIHHSWTEIVRIMDTQKLITSEFENRQGEFFMLTNWSTPKDEVKQIYDALGFKYQRSAGFFCKVEKPKPS